MAKNGKTKNAVKLQAGAAELPMPVEFTSTISEIGLYALEDYLKAVGAPEAASSMVNNLLIIEQYHEAVAKGDAFAFEFLDINGTVAQVAHDVVALGGIFHGRASVSNRREDVPGCVPPDDGLTISQRLHRAWANVEMEKMGA